MNLNNSSPIRTIYLFLYVCIHWVYYTAIAIIQARVFQFLILPLIISILIGLQYEGQHTEYLNLFLDFVQLVVWWVGLGVLSSVGLGIYLFKKTP